MASVLRQLSTRSSSSSAARIPISAREIPFQRIQNRKTKSLGPSRPARCQFSTSRQWMGTTEPERSSSIPAKSSSEELVTSGKDFSNELKGLSNDTRLKVGKSTGQLDSFLFPSLPPHARGAKRQLLTRSHSDLDPPGTTPHNTPEASPQRHPCQQHLPPPLPLDTPSPPCRERPRSL